MREASGRLKDAWYAVGTVAEVGRKPVARTVLGERLAIWRDSSGHPVAVTDRCLHRNAPLSAGHVCDGNIVCPYHGWTYAPSGGVVKVPAAKKDAAPPRFTLQTWQLREQYGLVWAWMGDGQPDKEPFPMPFWDTPGWRTYYMVTPFDNGVTQLAENFMDVPHTIFVHKGWFRTEAQREVRMTVERTADSVLVTYHQDKDAIGFTSRVLNPRGDPMVHTDKFYMPNTTRVDYNFGERGFVITSTITPEQPYKSRVYTLISYNLGSAVLNRVARPLLAPYTRKVIQQDVDIMAVQASCLKEYDDTAFHHSEADLHHIWIEQLRKRAIHDEDPPPPVVKDASFWI